MDVFERIKLAEIYEIKAFSNCIETEWGVMFYDESNPTMHDTNHACILNDSKFTIAIDEIIYFYKSINIVPRIYLLEHQKDKFINEINKKKFNLYNIGRFNHFICTGENRIKPTNYLDIKELNNENSVTNEMLHNLYDVYMQEDSDTINRSRHMLVNEIKSKKCELYCGYYNNEPASIAMTVDCGYDFCCFDLVETAKKFQHRGFARELVSYMVNNCKKELFLFSENPTAIRIYQEAGFRQIQIVDDPLFWRAEYIYND